MTRRNYPSARLRKICEGYPREVVLNAVTNALVDGIPSGEERRQLAALLTHWAIEDNDADGPPIDDAFVERVQRMLRHCCH